MTPPHGPPDASPPQICGDVTGRWAGTWKTQSGLTGTWETQFVESAGGALSGTSVVSGTVCGTTSKVVGKRGGCSINFGLSTFGACTVEFSGTLAGDTMSGTFTVTAGTSDQGQWNGARVH